jgi:hypothetical protein
METLVLMGVLGLLLEVLVVPVDFPVPLVAVDVTPVGVMVQPVWMEQAVQLEPRISLVYNRWLLLVCNLSSFHNQVVLVVMGLVVVVVAVVVMEQEETVAQEHIPTANYPVALVVLVVVVVLVVMLVVVVARPLLYIHLVVAVLLPIAFSLMATLVMVVLAPTEPLELLELLVLHLMLRLPVVTEKVVMVVMVAMVLTVVADRTELMVSIRECCYLMGPLLVSLVVLFRTTATLQPIGSKDVEIRRFYLLKRLVLPGLVLEVIFSL